MTRRAEEESGPEAPGPRARDGYGSGTSPFKPPSRRPVLHRLVPVSEHLPGYQGGTFRRDLLAGLTVAALLLRAARGRGRDRRLGRAGTGRLGVATVGEIHSGLPGLEFPTAPLGDLLALVPAALGTFSVSFSDEILTARSFAGHHGQHVRADAELAAASLAAPITQGFRSGPAAPAPPSTTRWARPYPAVRAARRGRHRRRDHGRRGHRRVLEALVVAVALSIVDVVRRSATPHDFVFDAEALTHVDATGMEAPTPMKALPAAHRGRGSMPADCGPVAWPPPPWPRW